jgi:hypothetical protein
MELDKLRDQATTCIHIWAPALGDASMLVDECLASALKSLSKEFARLLVPTLLRGNAYRVIVNTSLHYPTNCNEIIFG